MTFLPIVERELQVAARRRFTYWTRTVAALLAAGIAIWVFETSTILAGPAQGGRLFGLLSTLTWAACAFAGVFLTADCLSEEKRIGTLGLLFLTDLRARDIVLGKLAASSLNGFYALLAVFPVLAMPLILGGVSWGEFARVMVGLSLTLLCSLTLGISFSAAHHLERPSMAATAAVMVAWVLPAAFLPALRALSPLGIHLLAFDTRYAVSWPQYEIGLCVLVSVFWLLLWQASRVLPNSWQDKDEPAPSRRRALDWLGRLKPSRPRKFAARGVARLETNPATWLFLRHRKGNLVWLVALLAICFLPFVWFKLSARWWAVLGLVCVIHAALKVCMAWEASRLLEDHCRAGGLELVLVSRLSVVELLDGCADALRQLFRPVVTVILFLDLISAGIVIVTSLRPGSIGGGHDMLTGTIMTGVVLLGMLFLELWALSWLGMWLALQHRQPWRAALGCALRLFILPWVVPVAALVLSGGSSGDPPVVFVLAWIVGSFLAAYSLGKNAKRNLHDQLREKVSITLLPATP